MPQVAVKVSYRGLGPLLRRTAARTLRPALARTAKQPYARDGTFRGSEANDRCLKSLWRFLFEASVPYWDEPLHEPYVQPSREQPNSPTRAVVRSAVQRRMIDASSRCEGFFSRPRSLIGTNRCTNPTSSSRKNSQTALRAVGLSSPRTFSFSHSPKGEGGPSGGMERT